MTLARLGVAIGLSAVMMSGTAAASGDDSGGAGGGSAAINSSIPRCPHTYGDLAIRGVDERSEERRVGKECMPVCRSRWSPYH